jgi:uncharacterized protein YjbJ (UPF0337 family)
VSYGDKAENKAQELKGQAKEWAGDATGNDRMKAEGAGDKTAGKAKQAGEHVKDAAHDVGDALRG